METGIKASLIFTIKNEKETINLLLTSINSQSRIPDEVIIVDGGSSDETIDLINTFSSKSPLNLIMAKGANISQGRNIAVKNSKYDIIVSTDGGCKLDEYWFERMVKPFEIDENVDVVSGVYLPWTKSEFEELASYLIFPEINRLNSSIFLPSSRSVAFRKDAWKLVGGYPEWLATAEDSLFDLNLKKAGKKFTLVRDAIVYWRVRKNIREIFKQFYNYGVGDGMAKLHFGLNCLRFLLLAIFLFLFALSLQSANYFIFIFSIALLFTAMWFRRLRKMKKWSFRRIFNAIGITIVIEGASILGYLIGLTKR